jgi:hypothetical protein
MQHGLWEASHAAPPPAAVLVLPLYMAHSIASAAPESTPLKHQPHCPLPPFLHAIQGPSLVELLQSQLCHIMTVLQPSDI